MSEPGQPDCTKRRVRREEQCLSNTEWVDGHICPCRVCEGEREGDRERRWEGGAQGIPCFLSAGHTPPRFI